MAGSSNEAYDAFARRIVEGGIVTDPWIYGKPRFRREPVFVPRAQAAAMARCAEDVAAVWDEACRVVEAEPELLDSFFGLTPWQKAMWIASQPMWHGIARADVFVTDEGLQIAELNCDTPTGEPEAVVLNALVAAEHPLAKDPNLHLRARFVAMAEQLLAHGVEGPGSSRKTAGIVYPTELPEDLALVRLYRSWLEAAGWDVVLGSPYNLDGDESGVRLFDVPVSLVLRHYKTDWWGERASAWDDDDIPDARPLEEPLAALFGAMLARRVVVINPFGAVVAQNKRLMAFLWEHIHRFAPHAQDVIRAHVPISSRLETMHEEQLLAQKDEWVLKSDYGAEGAEVILGRNVTDEVWAASIRHARPGRWIAQRWFRADVDELGETVNYGVFLVAGEASGIYARVQAGATDETALSAPTFIA